MKLQIICRHTSRKTQHLVSRTCPPPFVPTPHNFTSAMLFKYLQQRVGTPFPSRKVGHARTNPAKDANQRQTRDACLTHKTASDLPS
jgi:hypothetical protein